MPSKNPYQEEFFGKISYFVNYQGRKIQYRTGKNRNRKK